MKERGGTPRMKFLAASPQVYLSESPRVQNVYRIVSNAWFFVFNTIQYITGNTITTSSLRWGWHDLRGVHVCSMVAQTDQNVNHNYCCGQKAYTRTLSVRLTHTYTHKVRNARDHIHSPERGERAHVTHKADDDGCEDARWMRGCTQDAGGCGLNDLGEKVSHHTQKKLHQE